VRRPGFADRFHAGLLRWALIYGLGAAAAATVAVTLCAYWLQSATPIQGDVLLWTLAAAGGSAFLALGLLLAFIGWQMTLPRRGRDQARRKRLAALLSVRHGLAPGGLAALLEDDEQMSLHLQRFLAEHQVPYRQSLYDWHGRYLFASPEKVEVLARALLQTVGKGHDNELFVLLADLIELSERLEPLLRAVRVARARHHQVMAICPWPPGVEPPPSAASPAAPLPTRDGGVVTMLQQTTTQRLHRAFADLRQTFARIGVPVICAADTESVQLILDRMDRLRLIGRRR
jgi:hypothetical protein